MNFCRVGNIFFIFSGGASLFMRHACRSPSWQSRRLSRSSSMLSLFIFFSMKAPIRMSSSFVPRYFAR